MDFLNIIDSMKQAGVRFSAGLTDDAITKIEEFYEIRFPDSLKCFYQTALPIFADDPTFPDDFSPFPRWDDFSPENVAAIRQRMRDPYEWLKRDIARGFWLPAWGEKTTEELFENAPVLIPIFLHRYMPVLSGTKVPVISTVGRDTICYGLTLEDYLLREFCHGGVAFEPMEIPYIPLWDDLSNQSH